EIVFAVFATDFSQCDFDDVMQSVTVEDGGDRVADIDHQHPETAVRFVWTGTTFVGGDAGATDRRERTVEQADDVPHSNRGCRFRHEVAAAFAALGVHIPGGPKLNENLFEKLQRKVVRFGERRRGHAL